MTEAKGCLCVIRLRGSVNLRGEVKDTLKMLHLNRANHATLIPATPTYLGMLQKVKDHVTWGVVSLEILSALLEKRGRMVGDKKFTDMQLQKQKYGILKEIVAALHSGKLKLKELKDVKPVFRLSPPSGGYKRSLKYSFTDGGEMGDRGENINDLIKRMI